MSYVGRSIILVGMMGCGKSVIGQRLGKLIHLPFVDLDQYIEEKEKQTVSQLFDRAGEAYFRAKEREAIELLLQGPPKVIALGGGAFIQEPIRALIKEHAISIWIKAEFDILLERVSRKNTRPILEKGDKATILKQLMEERYPIYKEADITVETSTGPHEEVVEAIITHLNNPAEEKQSG